MTIGTSSFIKDITLFIRNDLRTNITDPLSRSSGFVMSSYPTVDVQYPIITIKTTNVESKTLGMQTESVWINIDLEIRAWGRNIKEKDGLTSEIIDRLRKIKYGTGGTNEEGIYGFRLTSAVPVDEEGKKTPKSCVMTFQYSAVLED